MPTFTVYTPCRDSAATLHRAWESLRAQTEQDLEWLVLDDGSSDGTAALVEGWRDEAPFPVRLLAHAENRGHAPSFNEAVRAARGRFFLKADADDTFVPDALATLHRWWDAIPAAERGGFAGVTARCMDEQGRPLERPFPASPFDVSASALHLRHGYRREKWGFTRTDLLRRHPMPEVDRFVPEAVVWRGIAATHRTRYVNDLLRTYHRGDPGSLSRDPRIRFPRGMAYYCMATLNLEWGYFWDAPRFLAGCVADYGRYARHARIPRRLARAHLQRRAPRLLFTALAPVSAALARRDRAAGRVPPDVRTGDWGASP